MRRQLALVSLFTLLACGGGPNVANDAGGVDARRCDEDGDGVSSAACGGPDCDDGSATVYPGAAERCNGLDDDCDGTVDEELTETFYTDADGDGHGDPSMPRAGCDAPAGFVASSDDCDDSNDAVFPGAAERCNGLDDDCDGEIDEGVTTPFFADSDGDGFGVNFDIVQACTAPEGYAGRGGDCDDAEARIYPGAAEMCDGLDNNCNGVVDEEIVAAWYEDGDGDGYGTGAAMLTCAPPAGWAPASGDCDDGVPAVNPAAIETCNGVDDDCDGEVDEGLLTTFYRDGDGDGYGGAPVELCAIMDGYVLTMGDCDDTRGDIHPGATEVCNLVDDNCDGSVDEMLRPTLYRDVDGDGYGDASLTSTARCSAGGGWVANSDDCDDARPEAYPGATELCNGLDDDCDGVVDNGLASNTFYLDADGDGYGVTTTTVTACAAPPGYADNGDDCYDLNSDAYPGAPGYPHQSGVCTSGFIIGGCDAPDRGDGSYDYDCDGVERPYSTRRISSCGGGCTAEGWTTAVPSCGATGSFKRCSLVSAGCASATRLSTCQCCN